jgi:hypothetical protein
MSQMKITAGDDETVGPTPGVAANEARPSPILPAQHLQARRRGVSRRHTLFLTATILSIAWAAVCAVYVAMDTLARPDASLDLMTMAAVLGGAFAPVAVIWLIALYLRNAADSRLSQALLTNPAALTSQQVSAMSSSISEGAHRLTEAAEIARNRVAEIEDGMARHTSRLLDVAETAARNADHVKSQLKSQNDQLVALIKDLTAKSDQIEAIVSTATSNLFGATDQAVLKAEQAGTLLASHAEGLTEATRRAETLSNGIEDSFTNSIDRIRSASLEIDQTFSGSVTKMREASKHASDEADVIGKTLADHSMSLTVAADHAADRAGFIARRLHKEVDELGQIADQVSVRTDQISASFANQGKAITDAAADFEHLAGQINVTADEARRRLEDETRSHAQEMQRVSELAAEKAREAVRAFADEAGVLQSTSDGIIGKVTLAGAAFVEQSERIDEVAREAVAGASNRIDQARVKLDEHLARLTRVTELADALTNSLSAKFASYVDQLSTATDQAASEANVIGASFRASGDSLMDVTRVVGERAEQMKQVLESERSEIERASRDLRAQTSQMEDTMKTHVHDMEEAAERAATWSDTAGKAFKHQTQEMTESADVATRRLMEEYAANARTLTSAATEAVDAVINGIENKMRDHSKEVSWISEQAAMRAEETLAGILGETRKFSSQTDAQFVELVEKFTEAVREQATLMGNTTQGALEQIDKAGTDFKAKADGIEEAASGITGKIAEAAENAAKVVDQASVEFSARAGTIESAASEIASQVAAKLAEANALLEQHAGLLRTASETAAKSVTDAGEEFTRRSQELETASKSSRETLRETSDSMREDMTGIAAMADDISARVRKAAVDMNGQDSGLKSAAEQAVAHLNAAGNLLERRAADLHERAAAAREEISRVGDLFDQKILGFARAASSAKTGVLNAGKTMDENAADLDGRARELAETIKIASEALRHEIRLLNDESNATLGRLSDAAAAAQRHTQSVTRKPSPPPVVEAPRPPRPAARPTTATDDGLSPGTQSFLADARLALKGNSNGSEADRSRVLASAVYLVESIEGLGVDTIEIFDRPIAQSDWRRYLSGETGLLGHSDALVGSRKTRALVRSRYGADSRFKSAVSNCLSWMSEVLEDAGGEGSPGRIAALRLLHSDIGTLYALLTQSVTLRL